MSDINRLPPICEACEKLYGLTLLACSGGAVGDVYLCRPHYQKHILGSLSEENACSECAIQDAEAQAFYQFKL